MRTAAILAVVLSIAAPFGVAVADDISACRTRQAEVAEKAKSFTGEARFKRLIDADLRRASQELAEGDADECNEALDHALKLIAGEY